MLTQLLERRETGMIDGLFLRRTETYKRVASLQLSNDKDMEKCFSSGINSLDMESQENRYLIASSSEAKIAIYDTRSFEVEDEKQICKSIAAVDRSSSDAHQFSIETVQWYPRDNGMFVSSSLDQSLKVWDANTLQAAGDFAFNHLIYCHHMSSIARKHCLVAVACDMSTIKLCDLKSGSSTHSLKAHKKAVLAVQWSPRSDYILASGGQDNRILVWDVRKAGSCMLSMDQHNGEEANSTSSNVTAHNGFVNGLTFTVDGLHLLSYGTDKRLRLWDLWATQNTLVNYGRVENSSKKHVQMAVSKELSENVVFLPTEKEINVFGIQSGRKLGKLGGHYGFVKCCFYDGFSQELYSGGLDSNLLSWSSSASPNITKTIVDKAANVDNNEEEAYEDAWSSDES